MSALPPSANARNRSVPSQLSAPQAAWLVAEREMSTKLRSKAYLLSTAFLLLVALAGVVWLGIAGATPSTTPVAATAQSAPALADMDSLEITEVADRAEAEDLIRSGDVDAAVLPDPGSRTGLLVIADNEPPQSLVLGLSVSPTVELLDPDRAGFGMRYILGLVFGLVFMMAAITFGSPITTSVVEEKQTRVIEILLSAIPARALLAGKVLGNTILAVAQIALLVAVGVVGLVVSGQVPILQGIGGPIIWFAVFFLFGFVLLAAMFAAAGSLVSRQEDAAATLSPVMYLTMIPYFLVILFGENPVVMTVLSYVPFSAPVAMPIRLFFGEAMAWEPLLALAVLLVSCAGVVLLGAKIYENSLLKMGARVKLRDALRS